MFRVSTPIFYVNSKPHIGHAYSIILADVIRRWNESKTGLGSLLLTGTDEHGNKVLRAAGDQPVQKFCDTISRTFENLTDNLLVKPYIFNRTTSSSHREKVIALWVKLVSQGAIYKGYHSGWYCTSDECFYPEAKIRKINGKIQTECGKSVEWITEDSYKFRLTKYLPQVYDWLTKSNPIYPSTRVNDLKELFEEGLPDLSVSRARTHNPWGIEVPSDPTQTIYVWLDALSNYFDDPINLRVPNIHVLGKDIVKFHAVYWPAFLIAADLPLPERLIVHGHWKVGNEKMSKSIGNVVDPMKELGIFGTDALRYLLLRIGKLDSDASYDPNALIKRYNLDLSDTLGNLTLRLRNPQFYSNGFIFPIPDLSYETVRNIVFDSYSNFKFHSALDEIFRFISETNAEVNRLKPWEAAKESRFNDLHNMLALFLFRLRFVSELLYPIMPIFSTHLFARIKLDKCHLDATEFARQDPSHLQFPKIKNIKG